MAQSSHFGETDSAVSRETGYSSLPSSRSASAGDRPSTSLARGIQIVEYNDPAVMRLNPQPMATSNDESVMLLEEYLSPRKLVRLCADDLVRTIHFLW
jgi:hypothetical protein